MKSGLPQQHNPFADHVTGCLAGDLYLASQMREASWNEKDRALVVAFSPDSPHDLPTLKAAIVERFRAMAKDQADLLELDEPETGPLPIFPFRVAAEAVVADGRPVLLVKVYDVSEDQGDTGDAQSGEDGLHWADSGTGYGQTRPQDNGRRFQTTPPP